MSTDQAADNNTFSRPSEDLEQHINGLPLFDHHCHGVVDFELDRTNFEALISESSSPPTPGTTRFDSQIGFSIRAQCSPLLGLPPFSSPDEYIEARKAAGSEAVNRKFLEASKISAYGVDTGHAGDMITSFQDFNVLTDNRCIEIVRLERTAEEVAERLRTQSPGQTIDHEVVDYYINQLDETLESRINDSFGVKSIAAYRIGLDFDPSRPRVEDVKNATHRFLETEGQFRLSEPDLIRYLLWFAIDRQKVIQFHIGYGDDDVDLLRCNPLHLTTLLRQTIGSGAQFTLLHCYPFHREAGYLADVFPHVYFDVGLAINYTGARSAAIIAESLETAPFGKILFSTDAFGLPELYYLGTALFREGLTRALSQFHVHSGWPLEECTRVADLIATHNAARVYSFEPKPLLPIG
ncbi:amidohydrolase family protein [Corynebacterium incognita]|uniref:Amidohydrolase family protein n=1 Tax=Corynebacterium incognita TaxID=2754725 RepID=A0A7G7CLV7_9CORY|nr:amidohydrolase family protein [Corynebacterium incognita]QNE88573.1 amidohydrolase family protein [Corynebacterium incognita]